MISMIDSLSLIYSDLWPMQIPDFALFRNSRVTVSSETALTAEFVTAITQNILDLESQPRKSKLLGMRFSGCSESMSLWLLMVTYLFVILHKLVISVFFVLVTSSC